MDEGRRKFCQASGLIVASSLLPVQAGCLGGGVQYYNGGPASAVAMNEAIEVQIPDHFVYVCRDQNGLYAMTAYCTHMYCPVLFNSMQSGLPFGFQCNCHGSTFDFGGQNPTAPATVPLTHFKLIVDTNGNLFIDPSTTVDPTERVKG
ncbi:MAG TPA: Rieske (2Fe-2S) protein [Polyangia bacterium]|nr:Rieske (2Fe-2S) protein [Polyangia bacterium]